jgi:malonyl CoA-acyl carrier protein transacylase
MDTENNQAQLLEIIASSNLTNFNKRLLCELTSNLDEADTKELIERVKKSPSLLLELSNNIYKKIIFLSGESSELSDLNKSAKDIATLLKD